MDLLEWNTTEKDKGMKDGELQSMEFDGRDKLQCEISKQKTREFEE